jgi:mannose-6-phosphate isomerase-like protein (cupin superfamily)
MPRPDLLTAPIDISACRLEHVPDVLGDYPGEMRMLTGALDLRHVAITYRRMPAQTGGKGGYGHHHVVQEEVLLVLKGQLQVKLDDEISVLRAGSALRIAPEVVRSIWNEGPADAELYLVSAKVPDAEGDVVIVEDFWPIDDEAGR